MALLNNSTPNSAEFRKEEYQKAANALRNLIKQSQGQNIQDILTPSNVSNALASAGCDEVVRMQMCIFMKEGNVSRYVTQKNPGVCSIECNNIVMSAVERSGLDQRTVISLLNVVLYALSMSPEQRFSATVSDGKVSRIWAITSTKDELALRGIRADLEKLASGGQVNDINQTMSDLNTMANAGIPEALYLKAKCYFEGIGMPKDADAAYPYLLAAGYGGSAEANAMLGDYHFEGGDLSFLSMTDAYKKYTALGAVAMSPKRQKNLKALIEERSMNKKLIICNFLAFVASVILNILLAKGSFLHGTPHIFWGCIAIALSAAAYGFSVFEFIKYPYDEQRWVIPVFVIISLILMLIVL